MTTEMYSIRAHKTGLLIHADTIEDTAQVQIDNMVTHPSMKGLIAIMPDVHAGAGSVIGFTGKFDKSIIANIVGVDIGCGVVSHRLNKKKIDFEKLDTCIRKNIPLGFNSRADDLRNMFKEKELHERIEHLQGLPLMFFHNKNVKMSTHPLYQLGTLGGGNHFIEIDKDVGGDQYLMVHTGSRNFGLKVANYFQKKAKQLCSEMGIETPTDLEYLPMSAGGEDYLKWMKVAQDYAQLNREIIVRIILKYFDIEFNKDAYMESVHNYIASDNIVRKGAIQAYKGQEVLIPLNMSDGTIIGIGKGNANYNYSAPHGAGRVFGRKEMKRRLDRGDVSMEAFNKSMKGIYSTSVKESTIDESVFAYKRFGDIKEYLEETVYITSILKPVYNLKSE